MARPHPSLIAIAAGRSVPRVDDDRGFVDSALEHRMAGLAFTALNQGDIVLGADARRQLAAFKLAAAGHASKVEAAALSAVEMLRANGADGALFKGIATEMRWYPARGTRPTADVDLMLAPESVTELDRLILALSPGHRLSGIVGAMVARGAIQSVDVELGGIWVDLHVDPIKVGVRLPRIGDFWNRRDRLTIGSADVAVLDAEASLIQAVIHLQKDRFSRLYGFTDVARIAAVPNLDWDWIHGWAADAGLTVHLNESLRVVAQTLDIDLPVRGGAPARWWQALWPERTRLRGSVGMTRRVRAHHFIPLTMPGHRLEALKWWTQVLLPPGEMIDYMHPDTSGPYPMRLVQYRARLALERHRRNRGQRRNSEI